MADQLTETAKALVADNRGILAADESFPTIEKRFKSIDIESSEENRRAYRDMLFGTAGLEQFISGVILFDETLRQSASDGTPFAQALSKRGIIPGIKVDKGAKALANFPSEQVTEGLDGLRERGSEYVSLGARFTKWRAVITIGDGIPTDFCIHANAHALARYAALSQESGMVPIVEPEVLMDGDHSIDECADATKRTLTELFSELNDHSVQLPGTLLKTNMVLSGKGAAEQAGVEEVARANRRSPPGDRAGRHPGHRLPVGGAERRACYRASQRDEQAWRSPVGAQLLVRPGAAGAVIEGVEGRTLQRRGRSEGAVSPSPTQRGRMRRLVYRRDGERSRLTNRSGRHWGAVVGLCAAVLLGIVPGRGRRSHRVPRHRLLPPVTRSIVRRSRPSSTNAPRRSLTGTGRRSWTRSIPRPVRCAGGRRGSSTTRPRSRSEPTSSWRTGPVTETLPAPAT